MSEDVKTSTIELVFSSLPGADDDPEAYATAASIVEATGLSKSTVNARLKELMEHGRIHWTEDNTPAYRQRIANELGREETDAYDGMSEMQARMDADDAARAAEASQDVEDVPTDADVTTSDPEATTVEGDGTADAPKKKARKPRAAKPKAEKKPKAVRPERAPRNKFTSGALQDAVLQAVVSDKTKTWAIYEVAQHINAYPTSVRFSLERLATKGEVVAVQDGPKLRYRAV